MTSYVSRHNPRRQVTRQWMIRSAERYDRFYDMAWEALQRGVLPVLTLPAGRLMFRWLDRDIEQSRTIAPADKSSESLKNRYSGARLQGNAGQGALYLASLAALLRERVHYSGAAGAPLGTLLRPGAPDLTMAAVQQAMAGQGAPGPAAGNFFHVYRLGSALRLADIRVVALARLFGTVLEAPGARDRFALSAATTADLLVQTVLDPQDYSAARGIADAVFDQGRTWGLAGLVATSARGDTDSGSIFFAHGDGVEGFVYALFGAPGHAVSTLEPVASYPSFKDLTDAVKAMPGLQWLA